MCLAFAGCGRPLHVWLAAETDPAELQRAIGIFMPRWPAKQVAGDPVPDIAVTWTGEAYRIQAASWPGGESRAGDSPNAANALAGLLIDGLLAHQMAAHCLHASASEINGSAVLFAGPAEAGKSTLVLRLAIRGCRHLADDRMLLTTDVPPYRVMALGPAAKARTPLPPGRGLQALVDRCWFLTDETISYLDLDEADTVPFGDEFPLGALVVPRRDPGFTGEAELRPAQAGEVARTLIEETTSPAGPGVIVPAMTRLADAVVALYSGNIGEKQGIEQIATAAQYVRAHRKPDDPPVQFVLAGAGAGREVIEQAVRDHGLGEETFRLLPLQPEEKLPALLAMADIHLLPQRAEAADLVMPSKLGGMLSSGRPVVASAAPRTQIAATVASCDEVVVPGDGEAIGAAVQRLGRDPARRRELGMAARREAETNWDRDAVLKRFEAELEARVATRKESRI